nr:MAG TPA: hypothetical protein [Caudoviricetes sp.]
MFPSVRIVPKVPTFFNSFFIYVFILSFLIYFL